MRKPKLFKAFSVTCSFHRAAADIHRLGVDHTHHREALHLPGRFPGHKADAAAVVGGDGCWQAVVAPVCQTAESSERDSFGAEDLGVGAASQKALRELHGAPDVQQRLLQLRPLQVEVVPEDVEEISEKGGGSVFLKLFFCHS